MSARCSTSVPTRRDDVGSRLVSKRDPRLARHPWRLAADIDKSVMLLADGKRPPGTLQLMIPTDPHKYRLRLRGLSVLLWVDHESCTIT